MKKVMMLVGDFALRFVGWFLFSSAVATLTTAIHRNATGGFLGWQTEVVVCGYVALLLTIWWLTAIKR